MDAWANSRRAVSMPLLYPDVETAADLARCLLEELRRQTVDDESTDSSLNLIVENFPGMLKGKDEVFSVIEQRGFDTDLISNLVIESGTRGSMQFSDHSAANGFKLMFDQADARITDACRVYNTTTPTKAPVENGRVFAGGLDANTTDSSLRAYFGQFGELIEASVILDKRSKLSRGFGFIEYKEGFIPDTLLETPHCVDGKVIGLRMYNKTTI